MPLSHIFPNDALIFLQGRSQKFSLNIGKRVECVWASSQFSLKGFVENGGEERIEFRGGLGL